MLEQVPPGSGSVKQVAMQKIQMSQLLSLMLALAALTSCMPQLYKDIHKRDVAAVRATVTAGADVNQYHNRNPPHPFAYDWCAVPLGYALLWKGKKYPPRCGSAGTDALIEACIIERFEIEMEIALILLENGADPNMRGRPHCSGTPERIPGVQMALLLQRLNKSDRQIRNEVMPSARELLRAMLKNGGNPKGSTIRDGIPLRLAAQLHDVQMVRMLLEAGAPPDLAMSAAKEEVLVLLVEHGGVMPAKQAGLLDLFMAMAEANKDVVISENTYLCKAECSSWSLTNKVLASATITTTSSTPTTAFRQKFGFPKWKCSGGGAANVHCDRQ